MSSARATPTVPCTHREGRKAEQAKKRRGERTEILDSLLLALRSLDPAKNTAGRWKGINCGLLDIRSLVTGREQLAVPSLDFSLYQYLFECLYATFCAMCL